ncbi:hypothetical protein DAI22_12g124200 [Oryza sativa Japonica Group]|nr:hypothetical protein DAI22_12g124200 [Oryza sativa Japonica Group]
MGLGRLGLSVAPSFARPSVGPYDPFPTDPQKPDSSIPSSPPRLLERSPAGGSPAARRSTCSSSPISSSASWPPSSRRDRTPSILQVIHFRSLLLVSAPPSPQSVVGSSSAPVPPIRTSVSGPKADGGRGWIGPNAGVVAGLRMNGVRVTGL